MACAANASLLPRRSGLSVCRIFPSAPGCAAAVAEPGLRRHKKGDERGAASAAAAAPAGQQSSGGGGGSGMPSSTAPDYAEVAAEDRRAAWRPVPWWPLRAGRMHLVGGYRQTPAYFSSCQRPLRPLLRFERSLQREADALRASAVGGRGSQGDGDGGVGGGVSGGGGGGGGATCVALYHRSGDGYSTPGSPYMDCLPARDFYDRVMPRAALDAMSMRAAASMPARGNGNGGGGGDGNEGEGARRLVFLVTSHNSTEAERAALFSRGAAAAEAALAAAAAAAAAAPGGSARVRVSVAAIDHTRPEVAMAALAGCAAASFSHGTFSWWTAYLTAGPVYYDRGMLDPRRHRACRKMLGADGGCGEDARAYVASHLPPEWVAV